MSELVGGGPTRCLHLLPDTDDAGAENQARYLLSGLRERGELQVELAYFDAGRLHTAFEELGIPLHHVPRKRRLATDLVGRTRRLRHAFAGHSPDILHTWLLEGNLVGLLAARAWPQTRVVITQRGSWNELGYPSLVRLQRLLIGRADRAISNSSGGAEMLVSIGMSRERISVIANGIPSERVALTEARGAVRKRELWEDREVVAWVGRISDEATTSQKDVETLFASMEMLISAHPTALLALIGPTREELVARGFTPPQWAQPLGWRPRPADLLNAADALVISSCIEGSSNVAGEALLLGLPVVTTDCGDHCGPVGRAGGQVVPVGNPQALAKALAKILARPSDRGAAREAIRAELSVERMVRETLAVYSDLKR